MKFNIAFILGISYICIMTGIAIGNVGQTGTTETYTWSLPVSMFFSCFFPFAFGYLAGKRN